MEKYTFICEYKKGTYIHQLLANNISDALHEWVRKIDTLEIPSIGKRQKEYLLAELKSETPTPIRGVDHVWCVYFLINKSSLLINIVCTK